MCGHAKRAACGLHTVYVLCYITTVGNQTFLRARQVRYMCNSRSCVSTRRWGVPTSLKPTMYINIRRVAYKLKCSARARNSHLGWRSL